MERPRTRYTEDSRCCVCRRISCSLIFSTTNPRWIVLCIVGNNCHERVSEYFVLLDFCRNEKMFDRGMVTVPLLTFRTANTVIKVARMFGEILDPVKEHLGNISVVRGMEPKGFAEAEDARTRYHRWVPAICDTHSVEFVTPMGPNSGYLDLLERDRHVVDIEANYDSGFGGDRVRVTIRGFDPGHHYTSADGREYPWTE